MMRNYAKACESSDPRDDVRIAIFLPPTTIPIRYLSPRAVEGTLAPWRRRYKAVVDVRDPCWAEDVWSGWGSDLGDKELLQDTLPL